MSPSSTPTKFLRTDLQGAGPVLASLWHQDAVRETGFDASTWLSPCERAELAAITHDKRRREWIAARAAMKDLLVRAGFARAPGEVSVRKDSLGAPRAVVWEPDTLRYAETACSISHCAPFVLCAALPVRGARVGVDIQRRTWRLARMGRKFMAPGDRMLDKDDQSGDETALWSFKESTSKLLGTGWACGFKSIVCVETAPGVCETTVPGGECLPGAYFWFGQHVVTLVWDDSSAAAPHAQAPARRRGFWETLRARRALGARRALREREARAIAAAKAAAQPAAAVANSADSAAAAETGAEVDSADLAFDFD